MVELQGNTECHCKNIANHDVRITEIEATDIML